MHKRERERGNIVLEIEYVSFVFLFGLSLSSTGGLNMLVCSICVRQAKHALFLLRPLSLSLPYHLAQLLVLFSRSSSGNILKKGPEKEKENTQSAALA